MFLTVKFVNMDYKALLKNLGTVGNLERACDNWYERLNNLQLAHQNGHHREEKVKALIIIMIERMTIMGTLYIRAKRAIEMPPPPSFSPGGIVVDSNTTTESRD